MKTIKTLLLVVAITVSSVLSASTEPVTKTESKAVTTEISKLLKSPNFLLENEVVARVKITLNDQNEMVILSIDTENLVVANYIKKRLNYTKLTTKLTGNDKTFTVPVRLVPKN